MRFRRLGRTGLKVSEIGLGTLTFGNQVDQDTADDLVHRALDAGVNFFDTADAYHGGLAEQYLGHALKGMRQQIILASKVHDQIGEGPVGPNDVGLSRKHIMDAVEHSLRRLGTDYLDLYQVHRFDPESPLDETLMALDTLVKQGKVRYIGCSNFAAWQLCTALWTSDKLGLARFDSIQPRYNLISRAVEEEHLPMCRAHGVGVVVYNPLAGGLLSGKQHRDGPLPGTRFELVQLYRDRYWHASSFEAVDRLLTIAMDSPHSPAQLALAWVLANPIITSAIIGASRIAQLDETLPVSDIQLGPEMMTRLDRLWDIVGRQQTSV